MSEIETLYESFLKNLETQGLKRNLNDINQHYGKDIIVNGKKYINFSSNDYLGLKQDERLIRRGQEWSEKYGAGSGASRLVTGNLDIFTNLEEKIARFKNKEAALIMVSGFQANSSVLPALFDSKPLRETPLVFSDKLNHASMHSGCKAAGIKQIRYRHNDMQHLEELLLKHQNDGAPKFILTESVFSMDGDIAPLDEIDILAKKHSCFVIVDEAHSTGVLGENGRGLADKADLVIGTFGKAFGSFGSYVACSKILKEYLINKCGGLIYATALPPPVLGSIDAALDIIPSLDIERQRLRRVSETFRNEMNDLNYDYGPSKTQIVPIIIGSNEAACSLSETLKENGLWVTAIRPPTVPHNTARLRFAFSSDHDDNDIDKLLSIFKTQNIKQAA